MDQIKKSDEKAFSLLYGRFWEQMYSKAFSILKDEGQAKDVVQEVWISVWERRMVIDNSNIKGYLINAVRFKTFNYLRYSKKKHLLVEEFLDVYNKDVQSNNIEELVDFKDTNKKSTTL
ncbi:RNA polymerase sigma factor [Wenyingzhuangia sp. 2_MG-2023]|uniref:RNA polymerase sigma factor n=1 Tax=Wenyingzhuangia sp. 2_MG-2023 TaxID=3062639 RepID=UPI0026E2F737|nr:sigma factor [Wenyingzhuangia sp. 2_MG-2023]MDO6738210.1 sigma factor [Wenyingzhuangia sp. 2_MG-2023]